MKKDEKNQWKDSVFPPVRRLITDTLHDPDRARIFVAGANYDSCFGAIVVVKGRQETRLLREFLAKTGMITVRDE